MGQHDSRRRGAAGAIRDRSRQLDANRCGGSEGLDREFTAATASEGSFAAPGGSGPGNRASISIGSTGALKGFNHKGTKVTKIENTLLSASIQASCSLCLGGLS